VSQQNKNQPTNDMNFDGQSRRSFKNFLLQPLLQIKLGLYTIIVAAIFCLTVTCILYYHLGRFAAIVFELTDIQDEVRELMANYISDAKWALALALVIFFAANILLAVLYTHRLVGPTVAFRRHIRSLAEGRYSVRTILRKGDAFVEVSDELNNLSQILEDRSSQKR
jgi:nitrogen fixation/metabolism regulation signal transduction histidine kinase